MRNVRGRSAENHLLSILGTKRGGIQSDLWYQLSAAFGS